MNQALLATLCDPINHASLRFESKPEPRLVEPQSGRCYPILNGIPSFVSDAEIIGQNKKYQQFYDKIARVYDMGEMVAPLLGGQDADRTHLLRDLQVQPGQRILEVSIGTGINLRHLTPEAEYVGLDLSLGMLRQCQRNLARWKRDASLVQGNAEALPFVDDAFDVVYHIGGINFFDDKAAALREMIRVARSGTRLLIADETESHVQNSYEKIPLVGSYFQNRTERVTPVADLVPEGMQDVNLRLLADGRFYQLTFVKP